MKKWLLVLALLAAWLVPARAQLVDNNLVDAVNCYTQGEYTRALRILETLAVAAPENDAVWYYKALCEVAESKADAAQSSLRRAVALDPGNYWYRRGLARLYLMQGDTAAGLEAYASLRKDFPDKEALAYELLDLYLKQNHLEEALDILEELERRTGAREELVRTRYDVLCALGRQEEGVEALEQYNASFASPSVLSSLGDFYLSEYQDSLARSRYLEALGLDSEYIPAVLGLSETYRHERRYPDYFRVLGDFFASKTVPAEAKGMYLRNASRSLDPKILQLHRQSFDSLALKAAEVHPTDSTVLETVGAYFYGSGRQAEAGPWFKALADNYPDVVQKEALYVDYLYMQQDWPALQERAVAAFDRFRELAFLDYANVANFQLKDYDAIIGNARYLLEHSGGDKQLSLSAWSSMGDAYHEKGDDKSAYKAYEKALRIDPDYAPVLNNYAWYLATSGRKLKKAYTMSKKTVEAEPDNSTYLDTFGWILHLMGRDLEAKPFFKHALLYGGKENSVCLRHYATVLEALGEADAAKIYRSQAERLEALEK